MELDEKFLKEFKDVYEAINLIGAEIFKMRDQMAKLASDISTIKGDVMMSKGELQYLRAKINQGGQQQAQPAMQSRQQVSQEQQPELQQAPAQHTEAGKESPRRLRTGQFQPGDKEVDVANVFYFGNRK